jgi:hypothetical protein
MRLFTLLFAALPAAALAQYEPPIPDHATEGGEPYQFAIPEPSPPTVFFLNLLDGESAQSPVLVEFGNVGVRIAPAGEETEYLSGHHHLLINRGLDSITPGEAMPATEDLIHFGDGSRETVLDLPAGTHRLQLLLADANHVPFDPMVASEPVTIIVTE